MSRRELCQGLRLQKLSAASAQSLHSTNLCTAPMSMSPYALYNVMRWGAYGLQEVYLKRMGLFARRSPLKFTVFFVTAGEVAAFRMVESFSAGSIDVMPVHISDIFPSQR